MSEEPPLGFQRGLMGDNWTTKNGKGTFYHKKVQCMNFPGNIRTYLKSRASLMVTIYILELFEGVTVLVYIQIQHSHVCQLYRVICFEIYRHSISYEQAWGLHCNLGYLGCQKIVCEYSL